MESPPHSTSIPGADAFDRSIFLPHTTPLSSSSSSVHQHSSSTLPHQSSSHIHSSPHYSTSSLPHKHTSFSLSQQSPPSFLRSSRSRTSCIPPTPAPTAPLPVCPSPQSGIRYVSPSCQDPHAHLQAQSVRWKRYLILLYYNSNHLCQTVKIILAPFRMTKHIHVKTSACIHQEAQNHAWKKI